MTLREALAKSWVSKAGCRGAWLGELQAIQLETGEIVLKHWEFVDGWNHQLPTPPLYVVEHRMGWQPWGEEGKRE